MADKMQILTAVLLLALSLGAVAEDQYSTRLVLAIDQVNGDARTPTGHQVLFTAIPGTMEQATIGFYKMMQYNAGCDLGERVDQWGTRMLRDMR